PPPTSPPLSLHDALPIFEASGTARDGSTNAAETDDAESFAPDVGATHLVEIPPFPVAVACVGVAFDEAAGDGHEQGPSKIGGGRSEEHTSELQSRGHLVC